MSGRVRALVVGSLGLATAGCASGGPAARPDASAPVVLPTRASFEAGDFTSQPSSVVETVLAASPERVWAVLPSVFRTLGIDATTVDERTRVIGNEEWRPTAIHGSRLSTFLQCGLGPLGPNADSYEVTAQLLAQAQALGPDSTLVRIVLDADARPRASSGSVIHCSSQGTLEARVRRLVEEGIASPGQGTGAGTEGFGPENPIGGASNLYGYRLPRVGDVIRVGCAAAPSEPLGTRVGAFQGTGDGALRLAAGAYASLAVPAAAVRSVEIRERHTRTRWGAIVGAALGVASGAWVGHNLYDPDAKTHYPRGGVRAIGAVLGGIGGALVGAAAGALVRHDTWVEVPVGWAVQVAGAGPRDGGRARCPTAAGG